MVESLGDMENFVTGFGAFSGLGDKTRQFPIIE